MSYTINDVREYLLKNDINKECELLSTEYKNGTTPLQLKCNLCGKIFERKFLHIQRKRFCCVDCAHKKQGELRSQKLKHTAEKIQEEISKDGYTLIGEYKNCSTAVLCQCSKGHYFNFNYKNYQMGQSRCPYCKRIDYFKNKDKTQMVTRITLKEFLREQLKPWRTACLEASNYTCDISGKQEKNLDVHHLKNLTIIIDEVLSELNLPLKSNYMDYTPQEIVNIVELFQKKHTIDVGVVLSQENHKLFHKIYGKTNNTIEQYNKFKYVMQNNLL